MLSRRLFLPTTVVSPWTMPANTSSATNQRFLRQNILHKAARMQEKVLNNMTTTDKIQSILWKEGCYTTDLYTKATSLWWPSAPHIDCGRWGDTSAMQQAAIANSWASQRHECAETCQYHQQNCHTRNHINRQSYTRVDEELLDESYNT